MPLQLVHSTQTFALIRGLGRLSPGSGAGRGVGGVLTVASRKDERVHPSHSASYSELFFSFALRWIW